MDEGSYAHKDVFFRVIVPVLVVKNTVLILITSPSDENNWVSRIIKYKDKDGNPLVYSDRFSYVCEKCARLEPALHRLCTHTSAKGKEPPFKDASLKSKWQKIYEFEGDRDAFIQENTGHITAMTGACFLPKDLERAFSAANVITPVIPGDVSDHRVPCVLLCFDPNGGGQNNMALTIGYKDTMTNVSVLCWADKYRGGELDDLRHFVKRNLIGFRTHFKELGSKMCVVCTESNGRYDGDSVKSVLDGRVSIFSNLDSKSREIIGPVSFLSDNGVKAGFNKTPLRTKGYIYLADEIFKTDGLKVHNRFGTSNIDGAEPKHILEDAKAELNRFRWPDLDPDNPRYKGRVTGKFQGESDDLAISILSFLFFAEAYSVNARTVSDTGRLAAMSANARISYT